MSKLLQIANVVSVKPAPGNCVPTIKPPTSGFVPGIKPNPVVAVKPPVEA